MYDRKNGRGESKKIPLFFNSLLLFSIVLSFFLSTPSHATIPAKRPADVCGLTIAIKQLMKQQVKEISVANFQWPQPVHRENLQPRHVVQKAIEVLGKINRYRLTHNMGRITIPVFPAREITPDEAYEFVFRILEEQKLLLKKLPDYNARACSADTKPSKVYQNLSTISNGYDIILGIRGYNSKDTYRMAQKILAFSEALRRSQHLPELKNIAVKKGNKQHPKHALKQTRELLKKIAKIEANLWMRPIPTYPIPKRVITFNDVYEDLGLIFAELQQVQYRLGLNVTLPATSSPPHGREEVALLLETARLSLPNFSNSHPLYQHERRNLVKKPSDVLYVSQHIERELKSYRAYLGIVSPTKKPQYFPGLLPRHVYTRTIDNINKVNLLRQQIGLEQVALAPLVQRNITPSEVYETAIRLDHELGLIYREADFDQFGLFTIQDKKNHPIADEKTITPSDVYQKQMEITYLLDSILHSKGYTPSDVSFVSRKIIAELESILAYGNRTYQPQQYKRDLTKQPIDVMLAAQKNLQLLNNVRIRMGMAENIPIFTNPDKVTPNEVYTQVSLLYAEVIALKVELGITGQSADIEYIPDLLPADAFLNMQIMGSMLEQMFADAIMVQHNE